MSPLQFAKFQCCNYEDDGSCSGFGIDDQGKAFSFGRKPKCVLSTRGVRCLHFEQCVAPMGFEDARLREQRNEAVRIYRSACNAPKFSHQTGRKCPECKERELEPRRRFCYICADKRKLVAKRKWFRAR